MPWSKGSTQATRIVDKFVEMVEKPPFDRRLCRQVLGVFAKQPLPGKVKTRLSPPLKPEQAAALYRVALLESVARLQQPDWQLVIVYAGDRDYFAGEFPGVPLLPQAGGDLGARLRSAFAGLFGTGCDKVLMIGSDTPDLPVATVQDGFAALDQIDLVLAPAADGGYVLIGTRRDQPGLFVDIPWSTDGVLQATRARARGLGLGVRLLAGWEDLDDVAALQRLFRRSPDSRTALHARTLLGCELPSSSSRCGCRSRSRE